MKGGEIMKQKILLGITAVAIFIVGFFAGIEYQAYQIRSAFQDAFTENTESSQAEAPETVMEQAENENMTATPKAIGDEIILSSLTLKVTSAEEQQVISSGYGSPKTAQQGSKFVVVSLEVVNTTKSAFTFFPDEGMLLIDDKGREYKTYEETIGNIDEYLNVKELSPGVKETGVIVYEIPTDAIKYDLVTRKAGTNELYKATLK